MISFFFKRKKIVVDAFTDNNSAYQHFQIKRSTSFLPEWWKKLTLPNSYTLANFMQRTNMRHCTGMIDIYRLCYTLPMWTELRVIADPKGQPGVAWQFADKKSVAALHDEAQRGSFMPDADYVHLKLISPWVVKSKESLVWTSFQPTYSFKAPDQTIILPGMLDFQWNDAINIQLMFTRLEEKPNLITLQPGEPLMSMAPMTDREVDLRHHHIDRVELDRIQNVSMKFNGDGLYARKLAKCPASHGGQS